MTSQYYFALATLWRRLDHLTDYTPICSADTTAFRKFIDKQPVFKFLASLQDEYDQVQCRILNMNPVPFLREGFAFIQNEESRRDVMLLPIPSEQFALISIPQLERHNQSTHCDLIPLLVVMIRISYIVITASDLVTLGRLLASPWSSYSRTRRSFRLCKWLW